MATENKWTIDSVTTEPEEWPNEGHPYTGHWGVTVFFQSREEAAAFIAEYLKVNAAPDMYAGLLSSNVALEEAAKLLESANLPGVASLLRNHIAINVQSLSKARGE